MPQALLRWLSFPRRLWLLRRPWRLPLPWRRRQLSQSPPPSHVPLPRPSPLRPSSPVRRQSGLSRRLWLAQHPLACSAAFGAFDREPRLLCPRRLWRLFVASIRAASAASLSRCALASAVKEAGRIFLDEGIPHRLGADLKRKFVVPLHRAHRDRRCGGWGGGTAGAAGTSVTSLPPNRTIDKRLLRALPVAFNTSSRTKPKALRRSRPGLVR